MEKKNDMLKTIIIAICAAIAAVGAIIVIAKVLKKKKAEAALCECSDECFDDECCCEFCEDDITDCCDEDVEVEVTEEVAE